MRVIVQYRIAGMFVGISWGAAIVSRECGGLSPPEYFEEDSRYPIRRYRMRGKVAGKSMYISSSSVFVGGVRACCVVSSFMRDTLRLAVDIELDSKEAGLGQNPIMPNKLCKHISHFASPHTGLDFKVCMHCILLPCSSSHGEHAIGRGDLSQSNIPHYLFVFSLTWLYCQTLLVHLMHIPSCLHIAQYILLQLWYWL